MVKLPLSTYMIEDGLEKTVVGVYMPVISHDTGLTSKMWKVFNQFPKLFDENWWEMQL